MIQRIRNWQRNRAIQRHARLPEEEKLTRGLLDCGAKLVTRRVLGAEQFVTSIRIDGAGYQGEEANYPLGTAHLLEHMCLFPPSNDTTCNRTALHRKENGHYNSRTSRELVNYVSVIGTGSWKQTLSILSDICCRPELAPTNFRDEGVRVRTELQDIIGQKTYACLMGRAMPHIYGRHDITTDPDKELLSLKNITLQNAKAFYHKKYLANNTTILVQGNVSHDEIATHLNNCFSLPTGPKAPVVNPPSFKQGITFCPKPIEGVRAHIGWEIPAEKSQKSIETALLFMDYLSTDVHDKASQMAGFYAVAPQSLLIGDKIYFSLSCGTTVERLPFFVRALHSTLENMEKEPDKALGAATLNNRLRCLSRQFIANNLLSPHEIVFQHKAFGTTFSVSDQEQIVRSISSQDIQSLASKALDAPKALYLEGSQRSQEKAINITRHLVP